MMNLSMFIDDKRVCRVQGKICLDHEFRSVLNNKTGDIAVQDNPKVVLSEWDTLSQSALPPKFHRATVTQVITGANYIGNRVGNRGLFGNTSIRSVFDLEPIFAIQPIH